MQACPQALLVIHCVTCVGRRKGRRKGRRVLSFPLPFEGWEAACKWFEAPKILALPPVLVRFEGGCLELMPSENGRRTTLFLFLEWIYTFWQVQTRALPGDQKKD